MTAIEMQKKYWENELREADRRIELYQEGSSLWESSQKRYALAEKKLREIQERSDEHCVDGR